MNELSCSQCFYTSAMFIRQCKCSYCKNCKDRASETCSCGGGGGWMDVTKKSQDFVKQLSSSEQQVLYKMIENTIDPTLSSVSTAFASLHNLIEMKNLQNKLVLKNLYMSFVKVKQENQDLKRREAESLTLVTDNKIDTRDSTFGGFSFSTPKEIKRQTPTSANKRSFDFAPFDDFFSKNK